LAYTPGVAEPCRFIAKNKEDVYKYTFKGNTVAVVSDGSAVLGLGNIGAEASLPVMEGKCALFKGFADIDAWPICVASQDPDEIVKTVRNIAPVFGGINLEDIKAPQCFEIEAQLQDLGIPVMHDDQHGTAVVVLAALINALKVVEKQKEQVQVVINGAGAAGIAVGKMLKNYGVAHIVLCDSKGIVSETREDLNQYKKEFAVGAEGGLADALKGVDVFIGVSVKDVVSKDMVKSMNQKAVVMAMANPDPEILPQDAKEAGAFVIATGRSDFPNQVNNVLGFPGIFKGALEARATRITEAMKLAAAEALAGVIQNPTAEEILPYTTNKLIVPVIAKAVRDAWSH
jgi:malate dehydrogenase (oxaloacetate-decarboxylating)